MSPPGYTARHLDPPPVGRYISADRLRKGMALMNQQKIKPFMRMIKTLDKKDFWIEIAVLQRINYKLTNSQRLFPRFRVVNQVRRFAKRFKELDIAQLVNEFAMTFWKAKTMNECNGEIRFTPSHEFAEYVMQRIIAATLVLDKMQAVLMTMFIDQTKTLNIAHFPGLMLVYMGAASRLYRVAHQWAKDLQKCYEYIQAWHSNFPFDTTEREREMVFASYGYDMTCRPNTSIDARRESMRSWSGGHSEIPGILSPLPLTMVEKSSASTHKSAAKSVVPGTSLLDDDDLGEVIERPL